MVIVYVLPFWILLPCVAIAALRWGGRPERSVAGLYVAAAAASFLPATRSPQGWLHFETWLLLVDAALLGALCLLVVRYGRRWIVLAASFQTISTLAHLARLMDPGFGGPAYALMEGISSYPTVLILAAAVWRSHASVRSSER